MEQDTRTALAFGLVFVMLALGVGLLVALLAVACSRGSPWCPI